MSRCCLFCVCCSVLVISVSEKTEEEKEEGRRSTPLRVIAIAGNKHTLSPLRSHELRHMVRYWSRLSRCHETWMEEEVHYG
jgi:hypothetical protein